MISDRLWRRKFDADPRVIGRMIEFSGEAFTIVGVMPPEFEFPLSQEEMWIPLRLHAGSTGALEVVARLRQGVTAGQAQGAMQIVARAVGAARSAGESRVAYRRYPRGGRELN